MLKAGWIMSCKYIIVVGGVISGTGKGVSAASIGLLLKQRGHRIDLIKFDPYLNTNAGILAPREHGNVSFATTEQKPILTLAIMSG